MRAPKPARPHRHGALVVITAGVLALGACGGEDPDRTETNTASSGLAEGERLYQANCASCHGTDLRGTDKGPSHLSEVYEPNHHSDQAFVLAAKNGVRAHHWKFGDMAPVPRVDDGELSLPILYVRDVPAPSVVDPFPT